MEQFCRLLGNSFAYPHPPCRGFVVNKGPTAIRLDGHRAVEAHFSRFFDPRIAFNFSTHPNREIYSLVNRQNWGPCSERNAER